MYNCNSGYVGYSRSVRSKAAIDCDEMPISLITPSIVEEFIEEQYSNDKDEFEFLKKTKCCHWKYVAKECTGASSWHHTGKYFMETNHYSLYDIAEYILENKESVFKDYADYKKSKQDEREKIKNTYVYATAKKNVWGGTRSRPLIIDIDNLVGLIKGDWLYDIDGYRHKLSGKNLFDLKYWNSYDEFLLNNPELKDVSEKDLKKIAEKF